MASFYILAAAVAMWVVYTSYVGDIVFINHLIFINNFNWFIKIILLLLSFFVVISSSNYDEGKNKLEFLCLMLLSLLGMFLIVSSNDLFFLYLSIELMSLPVYVLLGSKKSIISIESSVKYFIMGSIISVFMLLGISLIYGYFGTTNYFELRDLLLAQGSFWGLETYYILFSFLLIIITFFFKLGLAPFHF